MNLRFVLHALSFWKIETAPFPRRVLALAQAHAAAVLIGGALAYVLLALIWMSQIH
jgi:hypothetical protein